MRETTPKMTPMFTQYMRIKAEYPEGLLLYRMGDFYELFFEDAVVAARELQITLTSRNKDTGNPVPMCGVPWHALDNYAAQLIDKGYSVVVCDQVEDPKHAKGLVKREVTRILTPGTVVEEANLCPKSHNYLGAVFWNTATNQGGFAFAEASTGAWSGLHSAKESELWQWVQKLAPRELLLPESGLQPPCILEGVHCVRVPLRHFDPTAAARRICEAQGVRDLNALDLHDKPELTQACGAVVLYLSQTQRQGVGHLHPFRPLDLSRHLLVDELTERNLEIFTRLNGRRGPGTLLHVLDKTCTPMGGRMLEERLRHPYRDIDRITAHQEVVGFFMRHEAQRTGLRAALESVADIERLSTRIQLGRATPRDVAALRTSLEALPQVYTALTQLPTDNTQTVPKALYNLISHWDTLEDAACELRRALVDNPPLLVTEGGLFCEGYTKELDALIELTQHGEEKIHAMLEQEQVATGIAKLKLGYNRVFGYYFEVSRAASQSAPWPEHFIRRQSLANAERCTTERLKALEEQVLSAADKRKTLEYSLFQKLREYICSLRPRLLFVADVLAHADYWQALAHTACHHAWTLPVLDTGQDMAVCEGRHPSVEAILGKANFVPNTITLDATRRLCLLTGPNMAGKSTVLRQTALICLLAQMGSAVPATEARLGLVDRIFSRVGAADNLARGQSTFMVEMMETARILRQATTKSLVILDEIGRGTSTFDGLALAFAVVEDIAQRKGCRTLFATHYHELTALEGTVATVFTMNIAVRESGGEIIFLHRLVPGPSDRSYGVEVARLAGVPMPVVQRAREILTHLERTRHKITPPMGPVAPVPHLLPGLALPTARPLVPGSAPIPAPVPAPIQVPAPEHPLLTALRGVTLDTLRPLDALNLLQQWKEEWA